MLVVAGLGYGAYEFRLWDSHQYRRAGANAFRPSLADRVVANREVDRSLAEADALRVAREAAARATLESQRQQEERAAAEEKARRDAEIADAERRKEEDRWAVEQERRTKKLRASAKLRRARLPRRIL